MPHDATSLTNGVEEHSHLSCDTQSRQCELLAGNGMAV